MLRRRRVGSRVLVPSGRKRSPRRFGLLAASAIVALTALGTLPGAAADGTSSRTVIASADAYVTSSEPSANFGSATDLRIDSAPNDKSQARINRSYIRFDIPPSSEPPVSATLRLYATGGDKNGVTVGVASNDWDEPTITWDNTPSSSASPTVASGPFDAGAWVSLDVTALIPAAGPVTLALTSSAPAPMAFASREQGEHCAKFVDRNCGRRCHSAGKRNRPEHLGIGARRSDIDGHTRNLVRHATNYQGLSVASLRQNSRELCRNHRREQHHVHAHRGRRGKHASRGGHGLEQRWL